MKTGTFLRTALAGCRRPKTALCILTLLVFFVAAAATAGGGAPKKQTWTDKLAHIGGKIMEGYTKAKSWVSDKVNRVKGFFTNDPMLKYMSQKERRQNEAARQRILKVMKSRRFRTEREKVEWQKKLFDDLAQQGIVAKDPNAPGGDGGASQFWYDLEHKSGQFKKFPPRALKIDEQLKADDVDYRETSNDLGQTRARMLSNESKRAGEAAVKEVKKSTDAATGAGEAEEAIKGKADEVKENVKQGVEIADKTQKAAQWAGEHADDGAGYKKTLKENRENLKEKQREREAKEAPPEGSVGADAQKDQRAQDKIKSKDAGKKRPAGLDKERAQKPKSNKGVAAGGVKTAKNDQDRVVDEAGREIPAGEFENGDTVVSKNGDEYEKRNGKWVKTGENYGTYTPSPDKGAGRRAQSARKRGAREKMKPKEWHNQLKKNDPEAWKKVSDALKSGDPEKIDDVLRALGAKSAGNDGDGNPLRDAEKESGASADAGGSDMLPADGGGIPYENPNSWVPAGREVTAAERGESAQAANADQMGRIAAQGQSVDRNVASAENQHSSAESAAQGQRQRSSAMADAIVGGLTSGVAAGVDAAAGTIGAGAGNVVAGKIAPEDDRSAGSTQNAGGPGATGAGSTASDATSSSGEPWTGVFRGSFPFQWCMDGKCGKKVMFSETLRIVQHGNRLTGTGKITGGDIKSDGNGLGTFRGNCSGRSAHINFGNESYPVTLSADGQSITMDGIIFRRVSGSPPQHIKRRRPRPKTKRARPKPGHGYSVSGSV